MKKLLFLLLIISLNVYAVDSDDVNSAGFRSLSEIEKAEIIKMVAEKSKLKDNATTSTVNIKSDDVLKSLEDTDEWITIGTSLGKGLTATAKELGVAANDLANTRIGIIATSLIIWNYLGSKILDVIGGVILLLIGLHISNRIGVLNTEYFDQPNWLGLKKIKEIKYKNSEDWLITIMVFRVLVLFISIILIV